jgi:hypothetical protein
VVISSRRRIGLSLVVAIGLVGGVAPVSAVSTAWSIAPTPNPSRSTQSQLFGVSCPSVTFCIAVGDNTVGTTKVLAERWNGSSWAIMNGRSPIKITYASLRAISCPTTTSCFAVGGYSRLGLNKTLIEHWNGSSWTIMSSQNRSDTMDYRTALTGVSCPTATSCFAVGRYSDAKIIEHWNGSQWTIMTDHSQPPSTLTELAGVSCPITTSCFAVGTYIPRDSDNIYPLVEHWNGRGSWTFMNGTPSPSQYANLFGVSCPTPTNCFAVGQGIETAFIEQWHGRGTWSLVNSPNTGNGSTLSGVSCPSTTTCVAVGVHTVVGDRVSRAMVEGWNGSSWTLASVREPPLFSGLAGVTCPITAACTAVGRQPRDRYHYKTLVDRYA